MIELNSHLADVFLAENGLSNFAVTKIAGDASFRSYYRVKTAKKSYILMYAPTNHEDTAPFIKINEILIANNLSAPSIIAKDKKNGFLLLQDFGDDTFSLFLSNDLNKELEIYKLAIDALIEIQKIDHHKFDIAKYNHAVLYREVALLIDWYLPFKKRNISISEVKFFKNSWIDLFDNLTKSNQVLVLRDYHADNLMVLPNMSGFKSVGLLDFQDALIGSFAYDLQSLLEDARRDINHQNREKLFDYFISRANYDPKEFYLDYEIISLQRNIKILGIFARLYLRDKKEQYLQYLPRVENFVLDRLKNTNLIQGSFKELLHCYIK